MVLIRTRWYSLSRRGAVLALFGVVFAIVGYSYVTVPHFAKPVLRAQLGFVVELLPLEVWGWVWIGCGTAAVIGGLVHRLDAFGFTAATFMPALWGAVYFIASVKDNIPRGYVSTALWTAVALVLAVVAGMADPLDMPKTRRARR